jgi:hypothetical protein
LAYRLLDKGRLMPADSWVSQYDADHVSAGAPVDVAPFFDQLVAAKLAPDVFALRVNRALVRGVLDDPASDPLNGGVFVVGGGADADCAALRSGGFANVALVHEAYFNVNLLRVEVGQTVIVVKQVAPGSVAVSNAILDSGCSGLQLDQSLYEQVVAAFGVIDPAMAQALQNYGWTTANPVDQTQIDLEAWPVLRFVLQGPDGAPAAVEVGASAYWQFDAGQAGTAMAMLAGDGGKMGGESVLGLPMFCGHLVVFDRSASSGHGVVGFAAQ